jgi:hypothetical protein
MMGTAKSAIRHFQHRLHTQAAAHNEIDYLDNLPRSYSCNELYYKFRDVLLTLGARPGMQIHAYGCTGIGEATAKQTPHVELTYEVPKAAPPGTLSKSTFKAVVKTVEVGPGTPKSITSADCVLLDDMRQSVIKSLARDVISTGEIVTGLPTSRAWRAIRDLGPLPQSKLEAMYARRGLGG